MMRPAVPMKTQRITGWFTAAALLALAGVSSAGEIHEAIKAGDLPRVQRLLAQRPESIREPDADGSPPLEVAAVHGRTAIAEFLIQRGADVNGRDSEKSTPLHQAACNAHRETAELLISKGADVNAKNKDGRTPFDLSIVNLEIRAALSRHGGKSGSR